jgi:hypothetical protein
MEHIGHAMNKAMQYATNDDKIFKDLALINVKFAQTSFQFMHHLAKNLGMLTIFNLCN